MHNILATTFEGCAKCGGQHSSGITLLAISESEQHRAYLAVLAVPLWPAPCPYFSLPAHQLIAPCQQIAHISITSPVMHFQTRPLHVQLKLKDGLCLPAGCQLLREQKLDCALQPLADPCTIPTGMASERGFVRPSTAKFPQCIGPHMQRHSSMECQRHGKA